MPKNRDDGIRKVRYYLLSVQSFLKITDKHWSVLQVLF